MSAYAQKGSKLVFQHLAKSTPVRMTQIQRYSQNQSPAKINILNNGLTLTLKRNSDLQRTGEKQKYVHLTQRGKNITESIIKGSDRSSSYIAIATNGKITRVKTQATVIKAETSVN